MFSAPKAFEYNFRKLMATMTKHQVTLLDIRVDISSQCIMEKPGKQNYLQVRVNYTSTSSKCLLTRKNLSSIRRRNGAVPLR